QIVDEQHLPTQLAASHGDVLGDSELALPRACLFTIAAGGQDGERDVVNARDHVTNPQPTARQTEEGVEAVAGFVELQGELLDQPIVVVPSDVQILHWLVLQAIDSDAANFAVVLPLLPAIQELSPVLRTGT